MFVIFFGNESDFIATKNANLAGGSHNFRKTPERGSICGYIRRLNLTIEGKIMSGTCS